VVGVNECNKYQNNCVPLDLKSTLGASYVLALLPSTTLSTSYVLALLPSTTGVARHHSGLMSRMQPRLAHHKERETRARARHTHTHTHRQTHTLSVCVWRERPPDLLHAGDIDIHDTHGVFIRSTVRLSRPPPPAAAPPGTHPPSTLQIPRILCHISCSVFMSRTWS